jgi:cell division protein FtsL
MFRDLRQRGESLQSLGVALTLVFVLLVIGLAIVHLYLSGRIVVEARHLQEMRKELHDLRQANSEVEGEISRYVEVRDLIRRAAGMGLGPAEKIVAVEQ